MRTVLHIGMNKTGSTSLQNTLHKNRDPLLRAGILYPLAGRGHIGTSAIFHYEMSRILGFANAPADPAKNAAESAALKAGLAAEISDTKPDTLILSSEYFCLRRDISQLQGFLDGHDLTIVVYLRRHDFWYASLYAQAVFSIPGKLPWKPGFAGYIDWVKSHRDHFPSHGSLLDHWSRAFPAARIVARPLPCDLRTDRRKKAAAINLWQDFLDHAGIAVPRSLYETPPAHENRSGGAAQVQEAERLHRMKDGETDLDFPVFPDLAAADPLREIVAAHEDDYQKIAEEYLRLPGVPLFSALS